MNSRNTEHFSLFKSNYEKLAGRVYLASKPAEAMHFVQQIFSESSVSKVVVAHIAEDLEKELNKFLRKKNIPTVEVNLNESSCADQINEADIGITAALFAIAFTGTIVEVTTEDVHRLVSSLPRVHIAFLDAAQIVHSLEEAVPRLREIYQTHRENCNITFISGPSRTADIEMKLFLGVHGPQQSHVIVCDWQRKPSPFRRFFSKFEN